MTIGQLSAYYGAVAQVIPVIALALLIESRIVAGRFAKARSKKSFRKDRARRIRWGASLAVVASLLLVSEMHALSYLLADPSESLDDYDLVMRTLMFLSIALGLLLTFSQPLSRTVGPALGELIAVVAVKQPLSKPRRLRRRTRTQIDRLDRIAARIRDVIHARLMNANEYVLQSFELERSRDDLRLALDAGHVRPNHQLAREARAAVVSLDALISDSMRDYEAEKAAIVDARRDAKEVARLRKQIVRAEKRLSKMIRRGSSNEAYSVIRAALNEAAKQR